LLFVISKLLWELIEPSHLMLATAALGLVLWRLHRPRLGYCLAVLGTGSMVAVTVLPIPRLLLAPLENRFPLPQTLPADLAGIIVLGGAVDPVETAARGIPSLNSSAERMTTFVKVARLYPSAKKVFSGGIGTLRRSKRTEAEVARQLFSDLGLDPTNIVFEEISRNTYENVLYSRQLVNPEPDQKWLLITSAEHMPRAVGIFRQLNWPVIPYPVAYKSDSEYEADGFGASLEKLDGAVREWCGLLAYRFLGRTDSLFPGP
jgi:uncharacterized SAM-binding protein YcdF (DUF218 family)